MNRKPVLYTFIGLLAGGAAATLILLLTVKPFSQVSQAQSNPSPTPSTQAVPGMPDIRELAQTIIDTQTAEINQMQQWYQDWYQ